MKTRILKWGMFLAIGLLYHCQQDDLRLEDPTHAHQLQQLSSRTVSLKELPKLADFVSRQISSSHHRMANKSYAITPFGNVDVEVITEVIDVYGNANYTFALIPNHLYENTFFNLVIYYSPDLDSIQSYVVAYAMTKEFATSYSNGSKHLGQFTGSIKYYDTQTFLAMDQKSLSRTNNCEEDTANDMDEAVTACEEIVVVDGQAGTSEDDTNSGPDDDGAVDNSNSGGSTSTSDGSTGNVSSGGGSAEFTKFCNFIGVYTMNCGGTNSNALHLASTCQGPDIASATFFNGYDCGGGNLVFDPIKSSACGSTGTAAIIPVPFYKLSLALGLDAAESECLDEHCELKNQIYDYLNGHIDNNGDYEEEALNFVSAVIDELTDTCETDFEVDFDEGIIFYNEFEDYPCHKEVLRDAISICSPLTQVVLDVFEANDYVNLIFKTSDQIIENANTTLFSTYNSSNSTCNITITFRESYLETATDLSIARTTIHESLHAILVYMFEEGLLESDDGTPLEGFENVLGAYLSYLSGLPPNFGTSQHELMSEMVQDMATSLSSYGQSSGYSYPFSFYEKLCWGGLTGTESFDALYPELIDSSLGNIPDNINFERYDVIYTIVSEQNNQTYNFNLNGTNYEYLPKGNAPNVSEPCD